MILLVYALLQLYWAGFELYAVVQQYHTESYCCWCNEYTPRMTSIMIQGAGWSTGTPILLAVVHCPAFWIQKSISCKSLRKKQQPALPLVLSGAFCKRHKTCKKKNCRPAGMSNVPVRLSISSFVYCCCTIRIMMYCLYYLLLCTCNVPPPFHVINI